MPALAQLFVPVRPDARGFGPELQSDLRKVDVKQSGQKVGDTFATGFSGAVLRLGAAIGGLLVSRALVQGIKGSVDAASDLNETVNKSNIIFGANAKVVESWAEGAVRSFGLSKNGALSAAATFGDMFSQIGFGADQAANMSQGVVELAADLGSFNNLGTEDVLERIAAGFRGEYDSLQKVIPNINAARVQTEALAMTGKDNVKELTAQEKATAVLSIIQKDGARAAGDFARTSGGLANQQKILAAQVETLKTKIGQALMPAFIAVAGALNEKVLPALIALAEEHGPQVAKFFEDLIPSIQGVIDILARGDFTGPIFGQVEDSGLVDFLFDVREGFQALFEGSAEASPGVERIAAAFEDLRPVIEELRASIPSLNDLINVGATVLEFFADNAEVLAEIMPVLVAGIVAYKVAQLAANVAALANIPIKITEIAVNRQLIRSNATLVASRVGMVSATTAATAAESTGTVVKARSTVATIAATVASKAARAAVIAWTAAQWLLNAALTANPIGLVVAALIAVGVALVLAWQKSETFREVVKKAFEVVWGAIKFVWDWLKQNWPLLLAILTGPIGLAVLAIIKNWDKIKAGVTALVNWVKQRFIDFVNELIKLRDKVRDFKDRVVQFFQNVADGAKAWFNTMLANIKAPIKSPFRWINDNLIKNVNKITSKFGLTIGLLPTNFNKGGVVPGGGPNRDSVLAFLTPGEGVLTRDATNALGGKRAIESINANAHGGIIDWAKETIGDIGSTITGWLKQGAAFALDKLVSPIVKALRNVIPGPPFARDFISGVFDTLKDLIIKWGQGEDKEQAGTTGTLPQPGQWTFPIRGPYSVGRGPAGHGYQAQDFPSPGGTPVVAALAGAVSKVARLSTSYGWHVIVNHLGGLQTLYAHLSRIVVGLNQRLGSGQRLGAVGTTGNSTGNHLHFEVRRNGVRLNPRNFIRYDQGGFLPPGYSLAFNGTGRPEPVGMGNVYVEVSARDARIPELAGVLRKVARLEAQDVLAEYVEQTRRGPRT